MKPHTSAAPLHTTIETVNAVLDPYASVLGPDAIPYRNHVYRVANLCFAIARTDSAGREKIAVAAVFHDLGIWTDQTFDYLAPSAALARRHLASCGHADWIEEVDAMIADHHKITPARERRGPLAEPFRRADWIDVSRGLRSFGVSRRFIASVFAAWPSAGFHWRLVELAGDWFLKHPLMPLPMVRL